MNYRQQFDDAIGIAPKSTIDIDAIVTRQRRSIRRRRFGGAAAVGLALIGTAGAVAFGVLPAQFMATPAEPAVILPTASNSESSDARAARLTAAMRATVLRAAPDAVFGGPFVPPSGGNDGARRFLAYADIRVGVREGTIAIWFVSVQNESCDEVQPAQHLKGLEEGPGYVRDCVESVWLGETVVSFYSGEMYFACARRAYDYSVCAIVDAPRGEPLLTADQLQRVVVDEALTLDP